jgi:hypothetical protein
MRSRKVPLTQHRCGVLVIAEPHNLRHAFLQLSPIERQTFLLVLRQPARRVVDRIAAKNEKVFDPPVVNVSCELRNIDCSRIARHLANNQCLAKILERRIHCIRKQLHCNRLG